MLTRALPNPAGEKRGIHDWRQNVRTTCERALPPAFSPPFPFRGGEKRGILMLWRAAAMPPSTMYVWTFAHRRGHQREREREKATSFSRSSPPPLSLLLSQGFFPRKGLRLSSPSSSFEGTDNPSLFTSCVLLSLSLFYVGAGGRAGMRIYLFLRWHKKMLSPEESDFASALSHDSVCTRTHVTRTDKY